MDFCLYDQPPGAAPIGCSAAMSLGADPVEWFTYSVGGPATRNLAIVKDASGGTDPGLFKIIASQSSFTFDGGFGTPLTSTSFAHPNAMGAIGVGAAYYVNTPAFGTDRALLESLSSAGGTPILFDTGGSRLPTPVVRMRPQIVAPDGTNTTFFGSSDPFAGSCCEGDGFPNFFGTSAAAPHAAAVTALMLETFPGLTPTGVESVLVSSAHDMGVPGFDFDSGYGFVDGHTAVGSVHASGSCDGVDDLMLSEIPNTATGEFSASSTITFGGGEFGPMVAVAPVGVFQNDSVLKSSFTYSSFCP